MNIEEFRDFCLSMKGVTEELPFGPDHRLPIERLRLPRHTGG